MIDTEKLEEIIDKCGIIKEFAPLPDSILGYYCCDKDYYMILINEKLKNDERLYRTVVAEEVGHYKTTIGDATPRKYMCYRDRLEIDKKELMALKWATEFLIPTDMFLYAIKARTIHTQRDMIDHFYVTEKFFLHKLEFMAKQKPMWEIDEKRCLYLLNLPSVFIYEKF